MRAADPASVLTVTAVLVYGGMMAGGLVWMALTRRFALLGANPDSLMGRVHLASDVSGNLGVGLGLGLGIVVLTQSVLARQKWAQFLDGVFQDVLRGLTGRQAMALALLSGIGEELIFRGFLLVQLGVWLGSGPALAVSSVLFAAAHFGPDRRFLGWTAFAAVMGFVLGGLFLATGSLLAPIAMHVTINGLNLLHETWERRMLPTLRRR